MDQGERLAALEELKILKARYFLHLDQKDWAGWHDVFAADAVMDVSAQFPEAADPAVHVYHGADAIVASVSAALVGVVTVHHGHMPIITIESDDDASGIWAMEDNLFMPDGGRMLGYGHYTERYQRTDGSWRIAHTRLSRLKVLYVPGPGQG